MSRISNYKKVNLRTLEYLPPVKEGTKRICGVRNKHNSAFYIQTPKLKCVKITKNSIKLEFPEDSESFYDFFTALDQNNIRVCNSKYEKWFGKKKPHQDFFEESYISSILPPQELNGRCTLKVNIPNISNTLTFEIYTIESKNRNYFHTGF
jgi:hypothetical protein